MQLLIDIVFGAIIATFLIVQFLLFKKDRSKIRNMCHEKERTNS